MRIEEREPQFIQKYNPEDPSSLSAAMKQYAKWIRQGDAFDDSYCVAAFEPVSESISLSLFVDFPVIYEFLKQESGVSDPSCDIREEVLTETLLFACALRFPEMKEESALTCRSFVDYARVLNDSAEMWINSEEPFAIGPLLLLASVYPEYGYLLSAFYVPYWDDEHMLGPLYYMERWIDQTGLTPDSIKAFCYCDNSLVREIMLGCDSWTGTTAAAGQENPFDLLGRFRESEEDYKHFKDLLVHRFRDIPYLPYLRDEEYKDANPIKDMVLSMMMVHYPLDHTDSDFDCDEYLTQTFVNAPAEDEIVQIQAQVENLLGHDIVYQDLFNKPSTPQNISAHLLKLSSYEEIWMQFITGAFSNGKELWSYITSGQNKEVLSSLYKRNLFRSALGGKFLLAELMKQNNIDYDDEMWEELHKLLSPFAFEILHKQGDMDVVLRLLDVLFICNGRVPLPEETEKWLRMFYKVQDWGKLAKRYEIGWFEKLEMVLKEMSSTLDYVETEHVAVLNELLDSQYTAMAEQLPETIFLREPPLEEEEGNRVGSVYGAAEKMVLGAVILDRLRRRESEEDLLGHAARLYLEKYAPELIWKDLSKSTDFPGEGTFFSGKEGRSSRGVQKEEEQPGRELKEYLFYGVIETAGRVCSTGESEERAIAILQKHLDCDDEDISARQPQYEWMTSYAERTQKLLYIAHLGAMDSRIGCRDLLSRFLKLAFTLAPVRTCSFLAKAYKSGCRNPLEPAEMTRMLLNFRTSGLSWEGYWAFLFEEYADSDSEAIPHYRNLLGAWLQSETLSDPNDILAPVHDEQKKAMACAYNRIARNLQLKVLKDAKLLYPQAADCQAGFNTLLLDRISRELRSEFAIADLPVYFKNRLQREGYYSSFIHSNDWLAHPEVLKAVFQDIEVEPLPNMEDRDYSEDIRKRKSWLYIILQKKGDSFVLLYGSEELWMIRHSYTREDCNYTQCHIILADENSPASLVDELYRFQNLDFKEMVIEETMNFLKNPGQNALQERLISCAVQSRDFTEHRNYYDIDIEDILSSVEPGLMGKVLQMLGLISHENLGLNLEMIPLEYLNCLRRFNVDNRAHFKYWVWQKNFLMVQRLAKEVDVSPYVADEKLADQMNIFSVLAPLPQYHPLVIKWENHKSSKIRNHILMLKERYRINHVSSAQFKIADFGVYEMQGSTNPEPGSAQSTAQEPVCINETERIRAEIGMFIGFRFTAVDPSVVPEVIVHRVRVIHPVFQEPDNEVEYNTLEWTQNGYSSSRIFLGWHFEAPEELVPGKYVISALDMEGNLIAEKTFTVEADQL